MGNKRNIKARLCLALFLILAIVSVSHADYIINNVPERIQEHSNWCWDASSQSMLYYYEHTPSQCAIANYAFSRSDCCGNSTFYWNHSCNSGNYLCIGRGMDDVLNNFGPVSSYCYENYLPESMVQYEADAHRPFGMRFDWKGGGAHALVGRGYSSGYVYYMDPWPGNGDTVSTYAYVKESSIHWWTRTLRLRNSGETNLYNPSSTISDNTPTYSWQKVTDATWYRVYVNNSSGNNVYDKWLSSSDYSCSGSTCSYTPSTILASGTYTWWAQTWNSYGYGPWSNSKNFTVSGCVIPGKASLISPSGVISTSTPTYSWYENSPASWYRLYVYNDTDSKVVVDQWVAESSVCSGGTCQYNPGVAVEADNHRWWLQTWNDCGYGPWSDPLSFSAGKPAKATLVSPSGTIYTQLPTYTWRAVPSATWYELYVWDYNSGQEKIYDWWTAAEAGCGAGTGDCSLTPATALGNGSHGWWIQAWNGLYGDWSGPLMFNVAASSCGFDEQFNSGNAANWTRHSGSWNVVSSAWYYTPGLTDLSAFTSYNATYSNADYKGRFWRDGTSTFANRLIVRASGATSTDGTPANCYMFQYSSDGMYSVWKRVNGTSTPLKNWTSSSYINKGGAWNELRAWVSGSSLWFSINGVWVWSGSDSSLSSGRFGLGMYKGTGGSLWVDWARLDCLTGAAGGEAPGDFSGFSDEQEVNAADGAQDRIKDENGSSID